MVDAGAVTLIMAAALAGFYPVYGGFGFLRAAMGGLVLGLAVALIGTVARLSAPLCVGVGALAYLAFAPAFGLAGSPGLAWFPNAVSLRASVVGLVGVWSDFLTAPTPVVVFKELALAPFIIALTGMAVAASLAWRLTRPAFALIPLAAALGAVAALGTNQPAWPLAQALTMALVGLTWLAWRHAQQPGRQPGDSPASASRHSRLVTVVGGLLVIGLVGGVSLVAAGPVEAAMDRTAPRDRIVPPLDLREQPSPLINYRQLVGHQKDVTLMTVQGLPDNTRLRLAVLDTYDGLVFNVGSGLGPGAGQYLRCGSNSITEQTAELTKVQVQIGDYSGVWVPGAGRLTGLEFTGLDASSLQEQLYYNPVAAGAVVPVGLGIGQRYSFEAAISPPVTLDDVAGESVANIQMPPVSNAPDVVASAASSYTGEETDSVKRLSAMTEALKDPARGFFSHGLAGQTPSLPGHGTKRIQDFLSAEQMVGDDEQYAVAMTLMARQLGMPARVVMGFYPGEDSQVQGDTWTVTGADAHAWVEVKFNTVDWVTIDPTPPENQVLENQEPLARDTPNPQVLQPPPPPEEPAKAPVENLPDDKDNPEGQADNQREWTWLLGMIGLVLGLVLLLLSPFAIVLALKRRRRRRRQHAKTPHCQVSGAWNELTDWAVDLGYKPDLANTRRQASKELADRFALPTIGELAQRTDASIFGPITPSVAEASLIWTEVTTVQKAMRANAPRLTRWRAPVSLASLRSKPAKGRIPVGVSGGDKQHASL